MTWSKNLLLTGCYWLFYCSGSLIVNYWQALKFLYTSNNSAPYFWNQQQSFTMTKQVHSTTLVCWQAVVHENDWLNPVWVPMCVVGGLYCTTLNQSHTSIVNQSAWLWYYNVQRAVGEKPHQGIAQWSLQATETTLKLKARLAELVYFLNKKNLKMCPLMFLYIYISYTWNCSN